MLISYTSFILMCRYTLKLQACLQKREIHIKLGINQRIFAIHSKRVDIFNSIEQRITTSLTGEQGNYWVLLAPGKWSFLVLRRNFFMPTLDWNKRWAEDLEQF